MSGKIFSYMAFIMLHGWLCAHVWRLHLLSKQWLCDSSSKLQCLGSPLVLYVCTVTIRTSMQHANAMLRKGWPQCLGCGWYATVVSFSVLRTSWSRHR